MLSWIDSFTVLIQTITAVNFIYILKSHYIDSVFNLFFHTEMVDSLYEKDNNEIIADMESLSSLDLDGIFKNADNAKATRDGLLDQYVTLDVEWNQLLNDLKVFIEKARTVKGSKCLFLVISLFCIFTLFNIGMVGAIGKDFNACVFWLTFTASLNILTFLYSIFLTVIIWFDAWRTRKDTVCYRETIVIFLIIVLVSFILAKLNSKYLICFISLAMDSTTTIPVGQTLIFALCVILPFFPCLASFLFTVYKLTVFAVKSIIQPWDLKKQRKNLHEEKKKFDNIPGLSSPSFDFK